MTLEAHAELARTTLEAAANAAHLAISSAASLVTAAEDVLGEAFGSNVVTHNIHILHERLIGNAVEEVGLVGIAIDGDRFVAHHLHDVGNLIHLTTLLDLVAMDKQEAGPLIAVAHLDEANVVLIEEAVGNLEGASESAWIDKGGISNGLTLGLLENVLSREESLLGYSSCLVDQGLELDGRGLGHARHNVILRNSQIIVSPDRVAHPRGFFFGMLDNRAFTLLVDNDWGKVDGTNRATDTS